jgi:TRAP-type C4-dicarboxylate transport system permease small subunit
LAQVDTKLSPFGVIRTVLDNLYRLGGAISALFLIAILVLILIQMIARWTGEVFPGAPDYAGYCMASASFFAFAYALNSGAHIRVSIVLNSLGKARRMGEIWCFAIGTALSTYFCYYAIKTTYWSRKLNDISQGQDALPIWIPQLSMAIGATMLAICFWDNLLNLIFVGDHHITSEKLKQADAD